MLKPLGDRVIIKVIEEEEKTAGGLVLTSANKEQSQIGEVVAVPTPCEKCGDENKVPVKVGDKVIFEKFAGSTVEDQGNEYLIMHAKDIMAIVE